MTEKQEVQASEGRQKGGRRNEGEREERLLT